MDLSKTCFLICDDSILARKKIKTTITALGATKIYEAADGIEAVEMYKKNKPDFVFMDIIMPKKEGLEALKEIMTFDPEAKVIMASSVGTQSHLAQAIEIGAVNFLQKPVEPEELKKLLKPWFGGDN